MAYLLANNVFPFVIASKTSLWAQANDNGVNASVESRFHKFYSKWLRDHPYLPHSRAAVNKCLVQTFDFLDKQYATELRVSDENVITRAFKRTGMCPVDKNCERWTEAIETIGVQAKPSAKTAATATTVPATSAQQQKKKGKATSETTLRFLAADGRDVVLRKIALDCVINGFTSKLAVIKDAFDEEIGRKRKPRGGKTQNTKNGMNVEQHMESIKLQNDARDAKRRKTEQSAATAKAKAATKAVQEHKDAEAARAIVVDTTTSVDERIKKLKVQLLRALLRSVGVSVLNATEKPLKRKELVVVMKKQFKRGGAWKH
jgi:hypothetical protein